MEGTLAKRQSGRATLIYALSRVADDHETADRNVQEAIDQAVDDVLEFDFATIEELEAALCE